jgi:hypothetical protein
MKEEKAESSLCLLSKTDLYSFGGYTRDELNHEQSKQSIERLDLRSIDN